VSTSNMPDVARYIRDQERHHRKITFQEELIAFLKGRSSASGYCFRAGSSFLGILTTTE
jgi:hypothetical protein